MSKSNQSTNYQFLNEMVSLSEGYQIPSLAEFQRLARLALQCFNKQKKEHNYNKVYKAQIRFLCKTLEEMSSDTPEEKSMDEWFDISSDAVRVPRIKNNHNQYYNDID